METVEFYKMKKSERPIIVKEMGGNKKTGYTGVTYIPFSTCSDSCPFKKGGCYAQSGNCGVHTKRISKNAEGMSSDDLISLEANVVSEMRGLFPLRLHVSGDVKTDEQAQKLAKAAERYTAKDGQPVWTYTHSWKEVSAESWGSISVFASCESIEQVKEAKSKGYKTSFVCEERDFSKNIDGVEMINCPNQKNKAVQCSQCKLCFGKTEKTVVFFPHGPVKKAKEALRSSK